MKYTGYHDYPVNKKYKSFGIPFMVSVPVVIIGYAMLSLRANPIFLDQGLFAIISGITLHKHFFSQDIFDFFYTGSTVLVSSLVLTILFRLTFGPLSKRFGKNKKSFAAFARFIFGGLLFLIPLVLFNFLLISFDGKMIGFKQASASTFSGFITAVVVILIINGPALLIESCIYNRRTSIRTVYTVLCGAGILSSLWYIIQIGYGRLHWPISVPLPWLALLCTLFYATCYLISLLGREGWKDLVYLRPFRFLSFLIFLFFHITLFYYIGTTNKNDTIISMVTIAIWFFLSWYCLSGLSGHITFPKNMKRIGATSRPARSLEGPKAFQWAYLGFSIACAIFTIEMFFGL